jgi:hypothetical protein
VYFEKGHGKEWRIYEWRAEEKNVLQEKAVEATNNYSSYLFYFCCFPLLWIGVTVLCSTPVLVIEAVVLSATNQIASAEHTVPT